MRSLFILPLTMLAATAFPLIAQDAPAPGNQTGPAERDQTAVPPETIAPGPPLSIATVPVQGVSLSGSLSVADGRATIGNNGSITAGEKTAHVALTRGGSLNVCASTKVHLSTDNSTPGAALMIALDRGAIEAHYTPGQYSDVLLTPDLRILISGPGEADLSLRVNNQGDTCIDNHGDRAPYVLASSLFEGGAYRVQPNQRVLFLHGSLRQVVDNEKEPCGCPPDVPVSVAGAAGTNPAQPGQKAAAAQNPFPLAESEGLQPPPPPATTPAAPAGTAHAQVQAPIAFNSANPALPPEPPAAAAVPPATESPTARAAPPKQHAGFFHHIGHFFRKVFGGH